MDTTLGQRTAGSHLTLSAIGHVKQLGADDSETGLAPTYMWYRKGRGETEFKLVGADGNLAAGTASKLEIDLTADDDGAQYYCHVGYNDVGLDTGTTLVNIEAGGDGATTVNATPIRSAPPVLTGKCGRQEVPGPYAGKHRRPNRFRRLKGPRDS